MSKTLDQYTAEERSSMVGMWCQTGLSLGVAVLAHTNHRNGYFISPAEGRDYSKPLKECRPRFDLPRAWTPDGKPVEGCWEEEEEKYVGLDGNHIRTEKYRRFFTDWEVQP